MAKGPAAPVDHSALKELSDRIGTCKSRTFRRGSLFGSAAQTAIWSIVYAAVKKIQVAGEHVDDACWQCASAHFESTR